MTAQAALRRPLVCGERAYMVTPLVSVALSLVPSGDVGEEDVERHLRCTLEAHATGDHHALVMDLPGADSGALWARWTHGHHSTTLIVLPDCPATETGTGEPCCEYDGHPGGHSYELADPWHSRPAPSQVRPARRTRERPRTLYHEPGAVTRARQEAGLTKRALARQAGISEQLLGEIESGWRNATPANLPRIAEALGCRVADLKRNSTDTTSAPVQAPATT